MVVGSTPVLQCDVSLQSPLPPTQKMVDSTRVKVLVTSLTPSALPTRSVTTVASMVTVYAPDGSESYDIKTVRSRFRNSTPSGGTTTSPGPLSSNVDAVAAPGSSGSSKVTETAVKPLALTTPSSGLMLTIVGATTSSMMSTVISADVVTLPPVSVARAWTVIVDCCAKRGTSMRCSKGKLPSVAANTPSMKNSTLLT